MGNPDGSWWIERGGKLERAAVDWPARKLRVALDPIAGICNKTFDAEHPILNARMADGSRLAAVIPPVAHAPAITIRKFPQRRYSALDLVTRGMLPEVLVHRLAKEVRSAQTILISGGTSTGKTTVLNALADFIPSHQCVILIEDTAELRLKQENLLTVEAQSHVSFEELLKASLRWRPNRIIVGEVRGAEARTLLDCFNTGHAGSLATLHSNSAVKALRRFALLVMRHHPQAHLADIEQEIAEDVNTVVHIDRSTGVRRVEQVLRVTGYNRTQQQFTTEVLYDAGSQRTQPQRGCVDGELSTGNALLASHDYAAASRD